MDATFDTAKMNDEIAKPKHCIESSSSVESWVEIWDYVGDVRFKGFVGGIVFTKSLFIFITDDMVGKEMKPGYEPFWQKISVWTNALQADGADGTCQHSKHQVLAVGCMS